MRLWDGEFVDLDNHQEPSEQELAELEEAVAAAAAQSGRKLWAEEEGEREFIERIYTEASTRESEEEAVTRERQVVYSELYPGLALSFAVRSADCETSNRYSAPPTTPQRKS